MSRHQADIDSDFAAKVGVGGGAAAKLTAAKSKPQRLSTGSTASTAVPSESAAFSASAVSETLALPERPRSGPPLTKFRKGVGGRRQ